MKYGSKFRIIQTTHNKWAPNGGLYSNGNIKNIVIDFRRQENQMENASKALLMAGGVLIAILIISVLVMTFQKTGNVSKSYDKSVSQEEITKFNVNFTKYLGQDLTIHQAITITNFAQSNGVTVINPTTTANIDNSNINEKKYTITINNYDENGYITNILISEK